jgi:hypothetical protein
VDGHRPDEALEAARVTVTVENEVWGVGGYRPRKPVAPEERENPARLALESRRGRSVVQEDDPKRTGCHRLEAAVERVDLRARLGVDLSEERLAEVGQGRVRESADKAFRPHDPDFEAVDANHRPSSVEHLDTGFAQRLRDLVALVRMPVVVPEDGDDRDRQAARGVGEHLRLVGLSVCRQVAGEQNEVGLALEPRKRVRQLVSPLGARVDVPGSGNANPVARPFHDSAREGTPRAMPNEDFDAMIETLKRAAAALREAEVPFMLGGGLACWARGGPESDHDLDLMFRPEDADRGLDVLASTGMRPEKPPEGWLYKAFDDNGVMVDLIFAPTGLPITDEVFERAEEIEVVAVAMNVMALEDVMVTKLLALDEQALDYRPLLAIARSLREQIDWEDLRRRTEESPFARAFFTLVEELGIVEPRQSS